MAGRSFFYYYLIFIFIFFWLCHSLKIHLVFHFIVCPNKLGPFSCCANLQLIVTWIYIMVLVIWRAKITPYGSLWCGQVLKVLVCSRDIFMQTCSPKFWLSLPTHYPYSPSLILSLCQHTLPTHSLACCYWVLWEYSPSLSHTPSLSRLMLIQTLYL